jgi:hypothetical protein
VRATPSPRNNYVGQSRPGRESWRLPPRLLYQAKLQGQCPGALGMRTATPLGDGIRRDKTVSLGFGWLQTVCFWTPYTNRREYPVTSGAVPRLAPLAGQASLARSVLVAGLGVLQVLLQARHCFTSPCTAPAGRHACCDHASWERHVAGTVSADHLCDARTACSAAHASGRISCCSSGCLVRAGAPVTLHRPRRTGVSAHLAPSTTSCCAFCTPAVCPTR